VITIPRSSALLFRQVLKRTVMAGHLRRALPAVLCQVRRHELVLEAGQGGLAVRLFLDATASTGAIAFPGDLLAQIEGKDDEPVTLEPASPGRGVARWADGGLPKAVEFEAMPPESARAFPDEPRLTAMPDGFRPALAEAVRTAARDSSRPGLTRILLRGKGGEIVASDSKQLLIQRGFSLPWEDDVLIPRVQALDGRPLGADGPVGIGRTAEHVVLRVPPWAFALPIDTENRFPGIEAVVPRVSANASRLQLDPDEAARLAAVLPRLPGAEDEQSPVTLVLGSRPAVRAKGDADRDAVEVPLERSMASGPVGAVALNRAYLLRALALGFTDFQVNSASRPISCRDRKRIYVVMPLEASAAVPADAKLRRVPLPTADATAVVPSMPRRKQVAAPVEVNGHVPEPVPPVDTVAHGRVSVADVIAEAVGVAGLLREAAGRVSRLVSTLKRQRHQTRAVQQAVRSLKELQLVDR
jgi:hypothetical protein